jgi:anti-sigma B factor antagonist
MGQRDQESTEAVMSNTPREMKRIRVDSEDDVVTVSLLDDTLVDPIVVRELGEELCSLVDESGHNRIILDCSHVHYIASAALNKLIILQKKAAAASGKLVLCSLSPAVNEVFTVTRLNQKFNIQKDEQAARECM